MATPTTQAAVLVALGEPLRLTELELPTLEPGQVLVDIAYSGVCHSQLNEVYGRRGPDRFLPHVLGHEGSGTVRAVGPGVSKVAAGDRVVLSWLRGSGLEVSGSRYRSSAGTVNSGAIATFMRATVTCESRVTPLPAGVPLREAALLGCAVLTGAGIVRNTARVAAGASVAVLGVGGIGTSAVLAAALARAGMIIAVDVVAGKLELAVELGATHAVDARREDATAAVLALTAGRGVDVAIEASGCTTTIETAIAVTRPGGGLCVVAGNPPVGERIALDPYDLIRGKRIVGTWGGESDPDRDVPLYARLFLAGELPLAKLASHSYPLADVNAALADLAAGRVTRALITMDDSPDGAS